MLPASVLVSCVLAWFLIVLLPVLAISRAGRSLLARFLFVAALAPHLVSSRLLASVDRSSIVLFVSPLRLMRSSSYAATPSRPSSCSYLIVPSARSFVLPVFRQARGGERVGSFFACLPSGVVVRAAGGVGWMASAGRTCCLVCLRAAACCVWFVVSVFVYINGVLVRVLLLLSKESD